MLMVITFKILIILLTFADNKPNLSATANEINDETMCQTGQLLALHYYSKLLVFTTFWFDMFF